MPTREHQLNRILADIDRQLSEIDAGMLKALSDEDLRQLIEKEAGLQMLRQQVEVRLIQDEKVVASISGLSGREMEVFTLIGRGLAVNEIAANLQIATSTVETYRERLKDKLDLRSGSELTRCAIIWIQKQLMSANPGVA